MKNKKYSDLPVWAFDSRAWGATSPDRKIGKAITEPRGPETQSAGGGCSAD